MEGRFVDGRFVEGRFVEGCFVVVPIIFLHRYRVSLCGSRVRLRGSVASWLQDGLHGSRPSQLQGELHGVRMSLW